VKPDPIWFPSSKDYGSSTYNLLSSHLWRHIASISVPPGTHGYYAHATRPMYRVEGLMEGYWLPVPGGPL